MSDLPPAFASLLEDEIFRTLTGAVPDARLYLVGGALRDQFLGLECPDLDLVVAANGRRISEKLAERLGARLVLLGSDRFAAYRLVRADLTIDLWDRQGTSIRSDLARRDLTVNAIALDLRERVLHDPFDGVRDLERRRLRAVTDASFALDPLRVLRLVRFALLLTGFTLESSTASLARKSAARIGSVAVERIRDELATVLSKGTPTQALELLSSVDLFPRLWSGLADVEPRQDHLARTLARYETVESLVADVTGRVPDRLLCVHTLITSAFSRGGPRAPHIGWPLLTRVQTRSVSRLLTIGETETPEKPRQFLARWSKLWREATAVWAATTENRAEALTSTLEILTRLVVAEGSRVLDPQPLLDGSDIQQLLDLEPGPEIGRCLARLLHAQLNGLVNTRREAVRFVLEASEPQDLSSRSS